MTNNLSVVITFSQYHAKNCRFDYYRIDSILQGLRSTTEISEILMFAAWFHIFHETEKVPRFLIAWATIQRNIFLSAELMPSK